MARFPVSWNPTGIKKLGFRGFRWFPISPRRQLLAGLLCTFLAIVGSLGASLLPIPNLNLVVFLLIGYFGAARIHPHPLIGPAFVSVCVIGLIWSLFMLIPDPVYDIPALLFLDLTANLFVSMTVGAILALVLPIRT